MGVETMMVCHAENVAFGLTKRTEVAWLWLERDTKEAVSEELTPEKMTQKLMEDDRIGGSVREAAIQWLKGRDAPVVLMPLPSVPNPYDLYDSRDIDTPYHEGEVIFKSDEKWL